ncbi:hypothetical protein [Geothrix fuzhouensis]|uniref:hypothetical protein n=1 Tax=Geothrix fuzhouensis TaxID=2966451 RepID=UPI00214991AB|nr:hypothetical protein [Geothrix fuzhouensis]
MTRWVFMAGALVVLTACGGGGGGGTSSQPSQPAKAVGLAYTDPASGSFRLVRDASSTSTKLILRLVGPAASTGRGVAFTFTVDPALADLVKVADADAEYVQNGDAFVLGDAPRFLKGIKQNGTVSVTVSQKGQGSARALDATLLKVAVQFKATAGLNAGTVIPISVTEGQYLPAIGGPAAMNVSTGSLKAQ